MAVREALVAVANVVGVDPIYIAVIFILFLLLFYKVLQILRRIIYVAIAAAIFPFLIRYGIGIPIDIGISVLFNFVLFGVTLYLIYEGVLIVYKLVKLGWKAFKIIGAPFAWLFRKMRGRGARPEKPAKPKEFAPKRGRGRSAKKSKEFEMEEAEEIWKMGEEKE